MKSVNTRSYSGLHFPTFGLNTGKVKIFISFEYPEFSVSYKTHTNLQNKHFQNFSKK